MRNAPLPPLLLAVVLGVSACQAEGPHAPVTESIVAGMHDGAHARPLRGTCTITGVELASMVPPMLNQTSTAVCQVSLLGRIAILTQQQINVATGDQTAEAVWTTASGDQLFATSHGTAVPTGPTTIRFSGVTTITGGTGRFANATGSAQVGGTADNAANTGSFTYDGYLQFDASNAAHR